MPRVGIALGSNLGDRLAHLRRALAYLREFAAPGELFLIAPVFQTEPRLCPSGSPDFYNSVVEISYHGTATELLDLTQAIEKKLGRATTTERNAPRVIDLDLLYFGDEIIVSEALVLPHPRLHDRRFVLQPLAAIRPDLVLAGQCNSVAELLERLPPDEPPLVLVCE